MADIPPSADKAKVEPAIQYNPRQLIVMAGDEDIFRRTMPPVLEQIASIGRDLPDVKASSQATQAINQIRGGLDRFFSEGRSLIQFLIYKDYAEEQHWVTTQKSDEKSLIKFKPFKRVLKAEELNEQQKEQWQTYLNTSAQVSREEAVLIVSKLIGLIPHIDARYIDSPTVKTTVDQLKKARLQVAAKIFPDIKDEEAKQLFGQLTTAEEVLASTK